MIRVLHTEPARYGPAERAPLEAVAEVDWQECADRDELLVALRRAPYDALVVRLGLHVDAEVLDAAARLRIVATPTTGLDHIDLAAAEQRAVEVLSLKGQVHLLDTVSATAELTWALLLATVRRVVPAHRSVLDGRWDREPFLGTELRGRVLGIVGCGRLGRMVAGYGLAFGMAVLVHDHDPVQLERAPAGVVPVGLEELLARSDVVSLHLPLDDTTRGFLSADRIAAIKPGAVLVNTARGELVDEAALLDALRAGRLAGLGLDVVADDATWSGASPAGQPTIAAARVRDDIVLTPHVGGYAVDAIAATRRHLAETLAARLVAPAATAGSRPREE